jgi:hypothetical protein
VSPLCEGCQTQAATTGHGRGERSGQAAVREEILEPSGPFLLPQAALPPKGVLEHLGSKPPPDEIVIEPSGPFMLPGGPAAPAAAILGGKEERQDDDGDVVVVESSGPLVVPTAGGGAVVPPVSLDASPAGAVDPYLHAGAASVLGGVVRGAPRPRHDEEEGIPSIVVDRRAEATLELPRASRDAPPSAQAHVEISWTPLAIAFVAGMLAGAALVLAILRL